MKSLFAALLLAVLSFAPIANAEIMPPEGETVSETSVDQSFAIPVRVIETKALVAPTGAAPGRIGAAHATLVLKVVVNYCRGVAPEQFVVDVQQTADAQVLEIRDAYRVDCRAVGRDQVVELHVSRLVAYKPVVIKNQYLIDWRN